MSTLLRLDPGHPPLWRTERILQFGVDAVATLVDPQPWQQRLVLELERGIPRSALPVLASQYGVDGDAVEVLVDALQPVIAVPSRPTGTRALLEVAGDDAAIEQLVAGIAAAGVAVEVVDGGDRTPHGLARRLPRILVAHNALDPARARAAVRDDAPHLPIVFSPSRASIGPLVVPGVTACMACVDAHRHDADPAWPMLLGQLLGRPPASVEPALAFDAGGMAAWLLRGVEPDLRLSRGVSVALSTTSPRRSWRSHRLHERCGCRSP